MKTFHKFRPNNNMKCMQDVNRLIVLIEEEKICEWLTEKLSHNSFYNE